MNKFIAISIISAMGLTFAASTSFANETTPEDANDYEVSAAEVREICEEEAKGSDTPAATLKECMADYGFGDNTSPGLQASASDDVLEEAAEPVENADDDPIDGNDTEEGF